MIVLLKHNILSDHFIIGNERNHSRQCFIYETCEISSIILSSSSITFDNLFSHSLSCQLEFQLGEWCDSIAKWYDSFDEHTPQAEMIHLVVTMNIKLHCQHKGFWCAPKFVSKSIQFYMQRWCCLNELTLSNGNHILKDGVHFFFVSFIRSELTVSMYAWYVFWKIMMQLF